MIYLKNTCIKLIYIMCAVVILAANAIANTANCSISPNALDISTPPDGQPRQNEPPEGTVLYVYSGVRGTDYTVTCVVDSEPAMVVLTGADMHSWNYIADSKTVSVNLNHVGFLEGVQDFGPVDPFGVAFVWAAQSFQDSEEDFGPPIEMKGSWMSTNVMQWNFLPPEMENPSFGFELSGPSGKTGFFHMFVPDTMLALMSSLLKREITAEDLAVFNDNKQASLAVTQINGGVSVVLNVLFDSKSTIVQEDLDAVSKGVLAASISNVGKKMTLGSKLPLSLATKKNTLKKNANVSLYGWLGSGKAGQKVSLLAKLPGSKTFQAIRAIKSTGKGAFVTRFKCTQKGQYSFRAASAKLKSPIQKVSVR